MLIASDHGLTLKGVLLALVASGGLGVRRIVGSRNHSVRSLSFLEKISLLNDFNGDGAIGAGLDTCRGLSLFKSVVTHITFSHNPKICIVFWDIIRAFERAILASDALIIKVTNNTIVFFLVSFNRTAIKASRVKTVMAGRGDGLFELMIRGGVVNAAYIPPAFILRETIEAMTSNHTGFATCALVKIYFKGILLSSRGFANGYEVFVVRFESMPAFCLMLLTKAFNGT